MPTDSVGGAVAEIAGPGQAVALAVTVEYEGFAAPLMWVRRTVACYIGSSSKISTAHCPSLPDRNGRPSVSALAWARSPASTIV